MYEVRKVNKRICIFDADGNVAYSMPFWVRVPHRDRLIELADRFNRNGGYDINAVMEFETRYSTVNKGKSG